MSRLDCQPLPLPGLMRVQRQRVGDARGHFARLFCASTLAQAGWPGPIAQVNASHTAHAGTVRGLHFQHPPHAEAKLVSALHGRVFDVAVDLRVGSPTFLRWHGEVLDAEQGQALLLPAGFAHGFQALSDDAELIYCHSAAYVPDAEGGLSPLDPRLAIAWPLPPRGLSARDLGHPPLADTFKGLAL